MRICSSSSPTPFLGVKYFVLFIIICSFSSRIALGRSVHGHYWGLMGLQLPASPAESKSNGTSPPLCQTESLPIWRHHHLQDVDNRIRIRERKREEEKRHRRAVQPTDFDWMPPPLLQKRFHKPRRSRDHKDDEPTFKPCANSNSWSSFGPAVQGIHLCFCSTPDALLFPFGCMNERDMQTMDSTDHPYATRSS